MSKIFLGAVIMSETAIFVYQFKYLTICNYWLFIQSEESIVFEDSHSIWMRRRWFVWKSFCLNLCKLSVSQSCEEVNISKKCCDVFLDESVVKSPNFCYPTERKNKSHMCGREGIRNGHVIQTKFTLICFPDQFSGRDYKTKYIIHQCTSEI